MVGIGGDFRCSPDDEGLVRELFKAGRRRARQLDVRWRSTIRKGYGYGYVSMDGNGFRVDMLLERLRRDLPTYAEAIEIGSRSPNKRRQVANGLVDVIGRHRAGLYDRYYRNDENFVPRLRALTKAPVGLAMYDVFPRGHPDLWPRLTITLDVITSWILNDVAAEVALEELHSAFEMLLRRAIGRDNSPRFPTLINTADTNGWLLGYSRRSWFPDALHVYWTDPDDGMPERDLLTSLNAQRVAVKHRGDTEADAWLSVHFDAAAMMLERLAGNMP